MKRLRDTMNIFFSHLAEMARIWFTLSFWNLFGWFVSRSPAGSVFVSKTFYHTNVRDELSPRQLFIIFLLSAGQSIWLFVFLFIIVSFGLQLSFRFLLFLLLYFILFPIYFFVYYFRVSPQYRKNETDSSSDDTSAS